MKTKLLATLAVLAMAFAGVAVLTDMEQDDAAAGDYNPVAYATASDMRVIVYDDDVVLINTEKMTNLSTYTEFYVGLTMGAGSEVKVGPVSAQNGKIYIDGTGNLTDGTETTVKLYGYGNETALASVGVTPVSTKATVIIKTNHTADFADVNMDDDGTKSVAWATADTNTNIDRHNTHKMNTSMDTRFSDCTTYGYDLVGFAPTYNATTVSIEPAATATIEDIIYAAGGIVATKGTGTVAAPETNTITLYAIWEKAVYHIYVYDDDTTPAYIVTDANKNADIKIGSDVVAKATASSIAPGAGYGILRISQEIAAQYAYTVTLYKDAEETAVATDGTEGSYTFLDNGTYRLNVTKNDLYVKVTASTTTPVDTTAFAFGIDKIVNDTVGKVNLSMDIYDYKVANTNEISLAGTYYKSAGDSQRIYGNIKNLTLTDGTNWKAYGDLAEKSTGTGKILDGGVVALSTAYNTYDLAMILPAATSIYAAQGFFDVDGDGTYDKDDGDMLTPWSLVTA